MLDDNFNNILRGSSGDKSRLGGRIDLKGLGRHISRVNVCIATLANIDMRQGGEAA